MNKKVSISLINSTLVLTFLLIISLVFISWAYNYVNKLTKNNINEYFSQTYNLVNLVIENEEKYLNDSSFEVSNLIYTKNLTSNYKKLEDELKNIKSIEEVDLLFLKSDSHIYDFSNSLFDTESIINTIVSKRLNFKSNIIIIDIGDEYFPMLLSQTKIEDKSTGRIKDILYTGKILNDNFTFLNTIKENANLEDVYIYYNKKLVATTSNKNIDIDVFRDSRLYEQDDLLFFNKQVIVYDDRILNFIFKSKNNSFDSVKEFFISQSIVLIILILILFSIFYLFSRKYIINPFTSLYEFAKNVKKDKNASFVETNIYEFDSFAFKMKNIIDELRDVKEQYTSAIDGVQDGLWDVDLKTKKVFFSNKFKEMIGYEKEDNIENLSFWFSSIFKNDMRKTIYLLKTHMNKESNVFESDYRFKCKNDSYKWIRIRGKVFFDEDDKPIRVSGFHTNIDELIHLQNENSEKERMLQQQSKLAAMGEMIGNIAHQWRQPLTVISINASLVSIQLDDENINKKECQFELEKMVETVQYLSSIIEKFMNFFDPNSKREIFKINQSIEENLELFEVSYKMDDIELIRQLDDTELRGNKFELMQVILNLINNSKDALKNLEDDKFIFIKSYTKGDNLVFTLHDNAGGISSDISDRIYEPYFTTKHKAQGIGLGLYMSTEIITKNFLGTLSNKTITYDYEGKIYIGEEFKIEIPLK
jgi:PAS domain S-box-containing protein